jgi:hypothetical protein
MLPASRDDTRTHQTAAPKRSSITIDHDRCLRVSPLGPPDRGGSLTRVHDVIYKLLMPSVASLAHCSASNDFSGSSTISHLERNGKRSCHCWRIGIGSRTGPSGFPHQRCDTTRRTARPTGTNNAHRLLAIPYRRGATALTDRLTERLRSVEGEMLEGSEAV